ncbi:MAG: hypothetical protein AB7O96_12580 [Pseudobdellovibrionaceae bacterium]
MRKANTLQASFLTLGLILTLGIVGCNVKVKADTNDDDTNKPVDVPYSPDPISGIVNNEQWNMKSGTAKPDFSDPTQLSITLTNKESADPCNDFGYGDRSVLMRVKDETGETKLGTGSPLRSATFFVQDGSGSHNLVTWNGKIKILEITEDKVVGQAYIYMDEDHVVNGTFEIPLCEGIQ